MSSRRAGRAGGLAIYGAFADLLVNAEANAMAAAFFAAKIREKVGDPALAALLTPTGFPIGAERICVDTDYYETLTRDHVRVCRRRGPRRRSVRSPRAAIRTDDVRLRGRRDRRAIGYDAMTGSAPRKSTSAAAAATRSRRAGAPGPGPIWASASPGSRTCSSSPARGTVGPQQHGGVDRTARRLDRRRPRRAPRPQETS